MTLKEKLKLLGWSNRSAAEEIGVSYQHLNLVLNGKRRSRRLMESIAALRTPKGIIQARANELLKFINEIRSDLLSGLFPKFL